MSSIRDYKGEALKSIECLNSLKINEELYEEYKQELNEINKTLNRVNPSLMFYGIFNAGKSSLLNAIFGEERASVSDVPETKKITSYKWKNFDIVDTPGINGPEEDYRLSKNELKNHDVVMFVVDDSDSFDTYTVTEEIVGILEENKPLIVVLNNKQKSDKVRNTDIYNKICENVAKEANRRKVGNKNFQFLRVNAKSGLKARKDDKKNLLDKSGVEKLEIAISQTLKKVDEIQIILNPVDRAIKLCNTIMENIHKENESISTDQEKNINEMFKKLEISKNRAISNIQILISLETNKYNDIMYDALMSGKNIDNLQQELSTSVRDKVIREAQNFQKDFVKDAQSIAQNINLSFSATPVNYNDNKNELKNLKQFDLDNNQSQRSGLIGTILGTVIDILPIPGEIKDFFGSLFKTTTPDNSHLEYMLEEINERNRIARENFERKLNAQQEARTQVNIHLAKFKEESFDIGRNIIEEMYEKQTQQFEDKAKNQNVKVNELRKLTKEISKITSDLQKLKNDISKI